MRKLGFLLLLLLPLQSLPATADERILDFHSDIVIQQDGWIDVTETIKVQAEGKQIRRGIYRDFPTEYYDKSGNRYEVDFEPVSLLRNDAAEDFHSQPIRDGKRVYFGSAKRTIRRGEHSYTFHYRASRMLGFFADHDELYWNVTGFDWAFPIDSASASVSFSFKVEGGVNHEAYTGRFGSVGRDYTSSINELNRVSFTSDKPLSAANGLTIVVSWPKGYVVEPTRTQRFAWLLKDNINLVAALVGFLALFAYYIPVWRRFGKDPDEGVIITRYQPPESYSPASLRYIRQMYYDNKVMTAAVVNLAVKGYLRINVLEKPHRILGIGTAKYSLSKQNIEKNAPAMAAGEKELFDALFNEGDTIELDSENHELLAAAKRAHSGSLNQDYNKKYFRRNIALNIPALLIVLVTILVVHSLGSASSTMTIIIMIPMTIVTIVFAILMRRPTLRGRTLLDQMLGFKDYLEVAEKDEMNLRNPPEKTPELFEAYLPYALALGVDQQWGEKFATVFGSISESDKSGYQPAWYGGHWDSQNFSSTTHQLSTSLNQSISSSVRAPGSSSGGGGGGSSGGGGGGGGGGGW